MVDVTLLLFFSFERIFKNNLVLKLRFFTTAVLVPTNYILLHSFIVKPRRNIHKCLRGVYEAAMMT